MEARSTKPTSGPHIRTELKDVTILFADIVKSTRIIETMEPERASEALDPVLTIMIDAVHNHGGTVDRVQGDGVMAIFGAPSSFEDHAIQACFAALKMIEDVNEHNAGVGDPIEIRVGIDSGQVMVRTYETDFSKFYDAVGFVVHLASKIEAEAKSNSVFLSSRTERLARGFIAVEPAARLILESKEYDTFRLIGRTQISRWTLRRSRVLCRIIGRDSYLQRLKISTTKLCNGNGSSILVEGEAGIGKSRLLYEFSNLCVELKLAVLRTEGTLYHQKTAFQPFRELFAEQLGVGSQEETSSIDRKLSALLTRCNLNTPDHRLALSSLFNPNIRDPRWRKADPDWRRQTVINSVADVIEAIARESAIVLIAEDIHLMDRGSTDLIRKIATTARGSGLLFTASQRPRQEISLGNTEVDQFIPLGPLTQEDAVELCDALLGSHPQLNSLKLELVRRTGGVPLFLEEFVLDLLEAGAIQGAIGEAIPGPKPLNVGEMQLPLSVTAILSSRIDRLAPNCYELLQLACVIGERFPAELLRTAAGLDKEIFERLIDELQTSGLIVVADDSPETLLTFSHGIAQQVSYRTMVAENRRRRHAIVANAMETFYGVRIQEFPERLAFHYTEAGELETAVSLWQEAAHRALLGAANSEAVDALETAVTLVNALPASERTSRKRLELQTILASALIIAKGPGTEEVASAYAECRTLAHALNESRELFRSLWGQWRIAWNVSSKVAIAHQLSELADQTGGEEEQLQAHHAQWAACYNNGTLRQSLRHISAGLAIYKPSVHGQHLLYYGGHDPAVCAYGEGALCNWILGHVAKGREMMHSAREAARQTKHAGSIGHALDYALFYSQHTGDTDRVLRFARESIDFAQEMALPHYEARAKAWLGWAFAQRGEVSDGVKTMAKAIEDQRETGVEEDFPVFLEVLAGLKARLGELNAALSMCDEALELAERSSMRHWLAEIHRRRGRILKRLGTNFYDSAIEEFKTALRIADDQQARSLETRIIASLVTFPEAQEVMGFGDLADWMVAELNSPEYGPEVSRLRRHFHKGLS